jgi:hypothetical protein
MRTHRGCNLSVAANSGRVLGGQMTWLKLSVERETMNVEGAGGREQENKSAVLADRRGQGISK